MSADCSTAQIYINIEKQATDFTRKRVFGLLPDVETSLKSICYRQTDRARVGIHIQRGKWLVVVLSRDAGTAYAHLLAAAVNDIPAAYDIAHRQRYHKAVARAVLLSKPE